MSTPDDSNETESEAEPDVCDAIGTLSETLFDAFCILKSPSNATISLDSDEIRFAKLFNLEDGSLFWLFRQMNRFNQAIDLIWLAPFFACIEISRFGGFCLLRTALKEGWSQADVEMNASRFESPHYGPGNTAVRDLLALEFQIVQLQAFGEDTLDGICHELPKSVMVVLGHVLPWIEELQGTVESELDSKN